MFSISQFFVLNLSILCFIFCIFMPKKGDVLVQQRPQIWVQKQCANCVQKQCANCVAKTAHFVYQKRCCKVMQMNTLRMLPRARVNKQTNKRTNKQTKHLSVLEKRDVEKTKTRGEFRDHIRSRFWLKQKRSPSPFSPMNKNALCR